MLILCDISRFSCLNGICLIDPIVSYKITNSFIIINVHFSFFVVNNSTNIHLTCGERRFNHTNGRSRFCRCHFCVECTLSRELNLKRLDGDTVLRTTSREKEMKLVGHVRMVLCLTGTFDNKLFFCVINRIHLCIVPCSSSCSKSIRTSQLLGMGIISIRRTRTPCRSLIESHRTLCIAIVCSSTIRIPNIKILSCMRSPDILV